MIRASQGHSKEMPVTLEALEKSWNVYDDPGMIWHGTNVGAINSILMNGLYSANRTHVHLAKQLDSTVGKRHRVDIMIGISTEKLRATGNQIFESSNGVILTRRVPFDCIAGCMLMTYEAEQIKSKLRQKTNILI